MKQTVKFYSDVFGLMMLRSGEGVAWCKLKVTRLQQDRVKHFA